MENSVLSHYSDENGEQAETEVLEGISAEIMDTDTDTSGFVKADEMTEETELLDGEEIVMEGLSSISDGNEELQVIQSEAEDISEMLNVDPKRRKVDKDDPRSRLHYIKYLKKEGKPMKMWECGICGKEFRHQYTLMRHLPTHTDERNYKCEDCGKAFRQMSTLSQHRAIHSDARPYVCECCKKTFNRVSTLISHRKTHSDLKPHKCPVCFKGFHQKGNLRNHVFTHTNERPYKCEVCDKGFNQMSNLVCHKAHVHGDKSCHVCTLCGNEFLRRYALRLHEEYTHGIVHRGGNRVQLNKSGGDEPHASRKDGKPISKRNVRIINLSRGEDSEPLEEPTPTPTMRRKQVSKSLGMETKVMPSSEVIIDPIETKAMKNAKDSGQTTFALFKPAKGIPVLVKVIPAPNNKQMLVPATVEDLKSAGKITVSPNYDSANSGSPIKAVQIKVPVVATVIQRIGENGQLTISVESPGPEQTPDASPDSEEIGLEESPEEQLTKVGMEGDAGIDMESVVEAEVHGDDVGIDSEVYRVKTEGIDDQPETDVDGEAICENNVIHYLDEDGNVVAMDGIEGAQVKYLQDDGSMLDGEPTVIMHPDGIVLSENVPAQHAAEYVLGGTDQGIMQLDTGDGVQLVRASGDGTYEVISEEEAALLMQSQDQTIEILDDNSDVQFQEMLEEGDDGQILVNQNNLSALVSAIRSAGYEVLPGEGQEAAPDEIIQMAPEDHMNIEDSEMITFKIEDV